MYLDKKEKSLYLYLKDSKQKRIFWPNKRKRSLVPFSFHFYIEQELKVSS